MTTTWRRIRRTSSGFTIIEMLSVIVLIGILAGIAIPQLRGPVAKADAARVYGDFNAVRQAAYDFLEENGRFPANGAVGTVPAEMLGDVPDFTYKGMDYWWISMDMRSSGGGFWGARAIGFFVVRFNGNVDIANAMRDRKPGYATRSLLNYYWSPAQAFFVVAE